MEIIEGVHRIEVPLQFMVMSVYLYLLEGDGGLTLVDCGPNLEVTYDSLSRCLANINRKFSDIDLIIITHYHADHYGYIGELKRLTNAETAMHRIGAGLAEGYRSNPEEYMDGVVQLATQHGMPREYTEIIKPLLGILRRVVSPARIDRRLEDGDEISIGSSRYLVIWTPGHSPDHICLYNPEKKVLFSGDHLLQEITPHIGIDALKGINPLKDYLKSLRRIKEYDIAVAFPGHGPIIKDPQGRIDEILHHHDERMSLMNKAVTGSPKTAYEVSLEIWGEELPIFEKPLALAETVQHLELLVEEGRLQKILRNSIVYFKK